MKNKFKVKEERKKENKKKGNRKEDLDTERNLKQIYKVNFKKKKNKEN